MIKVAALLGLVLAGNALAVEVDPKVWVSMASSENNVEQYDFYGKKGSFSHVGKVSTGIIQQG
mgnify:CR=1 FL=1